MVSAPGSPFFRPRARSERFNSALNVFNLYSLMVTDKEMAAWALKYPEVSQSPHFEKTSFRVRKKIFATLDIRLRRATLKLTEIDQSVFSDYDPTTVYSVPGTWGKQGWTFFELKKVRKSLFRDALKTAYTTVAPKSLIARLNQM